MLFGVAMLLSVVNIGHYEHAVVNFCIFTSVVACPIILNYVLHFGVYFSARIESNGFDIVIVMSI